MFAGFSERLNFGLGGGTVSSPSAFPTRPIGQLGNFNTYAINFITAAQITDATQQAAINQLSYDLVNTGLMDKMLAVYPFVGGTASSHQYNLKDPRDADSAFRLTFSGGFTHSSSGIQGNGTNAFATTYINAANRFPNAGALHISVYSTTNTIPGTQVESGITNGSNIIQLRISSQNIIGSTVPVLTFTSTTNASGHWLITKRSNTDREIYRNGVSEASSSTSNSTAYVSTNLILFGRFNTSTGAPDFYSTKNLAFASVGFGLTDEEVSTFYTIVQNFQTKLGRQI